MKIWTQTYSRIGGILYHSPEERDLAQSELGINHPNGVEIGTWLGRSQESGDRRQERIPPSSPASFLLNTDSFLVYCGRYSRQKNLPLLLEFAARYAK